MALALAELWRMMDDPVLLKNSGLDLNNLVDHAQKIYQNYFQVDGKRTITDDQDLILHLDLTKMRAKDMALERG